METPRAELSRPMIGAGLVLIILGFCGHYFAAKAIGGHYIAFRDHIFGFFLILVVTGAIIAGLGWKFWKGRTDLTILIIGIVQALFGLFVYIRRFDIG